MLEADMKKAEESNEIKIQVPTCHASSSVCTAYVRGTRFPVVVYHCGTRSPDLSRLMEERHKEASTELEALRQEVRNPLRYRPNPCVWH
eukprot:1910024-Rhodomonas_salina.4